MDQIGLALENFDAIGGFRTQEAGFPIDTSGDLMGTTYSDVRGFHTALRDAPQLPKCLVKKLFMHGVGRYYVSSEGQLINALTADFQQDSYDFVSLMRNIALSHGFRATSGPQALASDVEAALAGECGKLAKDGPAADCSAACSVAPRWRWGCRSSTRFLTVMARSSRWRARRRRVLARGSGAAA